MKLLIITNLFPNSLEPNRGIFNKQQFLELARLCELKVIAPIPWHKNFKVPYREAIDGIDTYHPRYFMIPKIGRSLYGVLFFLGIIGTVRRIEKTFRFDRILATWAYPDGFGSCLAARMLKKPFVIKVHGSDINLGIRHPLRRRMILYAMRNCVKVIAVSAALKDKIVKMGIPGSRIEVVLNGVNGSIFKLMDKTECRRKLGLPLDRKIVLYVGNLKHEKGVDALVMAMAEMAKDVMVVIVGDGEERLLRPLRGLAMTAWGRPHAEIPLWMNAGDVLCLPSRNEGCPNVVLEALSCGVPVVASRVGAIPQLVIDGKTGILVEPANVNALIRGLKEGLARDWDKDEIRRVGPVFSWADSARQVCAVLTCSERMMDDRSLSLARMKGRIRPSSIVLSSFRNVVYALIPRKILLRSNRRCRDKIALTFDDGPNPEFTTKVLDILRAKDVKATFFLTGNETERRPDLARAIVEDGHCVGAHSYSHNGYGELDGGRKRDEIDKSIEAIERITGRECGFFRPPQGAISIKELLRCLKEGITTVMWSVNSMDYQKRGVRELVHNTIGNGIRGGDIVLLHDDNEFTLQALSPIVDGLEERGFELVTVDEMLNV